MLNSFREDGAAPLGGSSGSNQNFVNDGGPEIIYRYRAYTKTNNGFTCIKTHVKMIYVSASSYANTR